jgi:hypothetical protein
VSLRDPAPDYLPRAQPLVHAIRSGVRILGAGAVVAVLLAISGAFGSTALTIVPRTIYWLAMVMAGAVLGIAAAEFVIPMRWLLHRRILAGAAIALIIAVPMSALVAVSNPLLTHQAFRPMLALWAFPEVLGSCVAMTTLAFLVRGKAQAETHAAAPGAGPPKFLGRLPPKLQGAEVWAVEAEDHYLRLHTSKGQDLILLRLSDAVAELEGIEGAQTHRSWWVAKDAVVGAQKGDGRAVLTLKDGAEVPVSRGYAKLLREAGWF